MHEFALGQRIVAGVLEELEQVQPPPRRVRRVRVVAGALHQILPEYLAFAYELLVQHTPAAGSRLDLEIRPVTARCAACGWEGEIEPPFFVCGRCAQLNPEMTGGREFYLDGLEVETE
jgi:hydrogenase nickel incorporation protein HypA/HybF